MNWDKGPMENEIHYLQMVREQLWRAYTTWSRAEVNDDGRRGAVNRSLGFYEGFASCIDYMGNVTRFTQLEQIVASVHAHERNIEILDDCILQVKEELSC